MRYENSPRRYLQQWRILQIQLLAMEASSKCENMQCLSAEEDGAQGPYNVDLPTVQGAKTETTRVSTLACHTEESDERRQGSVQLMLPIYSGSHEGRC